MWTNTEFTKRRNGRLKREINFCLQKADRNREKWDKVIVKVFAFFSIRNEDFPLN